MKIDNVKHIRESICKGCLTYEDNIDNGVVCGLPHKRNGHPCPCSSCLIKSVCVTSCELVKEYQTDPKEIGRNHAKCESVAKKSSKRSMRYSLAEFYKL